MPNEAIETITGIEDIELEMVIRGPPPHWCALRCHEYMRDPCLTCGIREITSIDHAFMTRKEDAIYLISCHDLNEFNKFTEKRGGEEKKW